MPSRDALEIPGSESHMISLRTHRSLQRRAGLLGLLALSLAATACADEQDSEDLGDVSLRPGPSPVFDLDISIAGDDVVLDWSSVAGEGSATVYRSTSPSLRADLLAGQQGSWDVIPVGSNASSYTDVGAASHSQATPTYYYVVVLQSDAGDRTSPMGMKISTAMAPGYNKMAVCMEGGPSRASDVVARLGSSVGGVWGWDAVSQSYRHWTPLDGVGGDADFALPLGSVFAAEVDGSTPAFQSLVGLVPATNDDFTVSARPGYNWATLPVSYDGPTQASYWVGQAGYWGIGRWNNLTQSQSWYWSAQDPDFALEACRPHYTYLPPNACSTSEDCSEDAFCYFVDAAACGDAAAGLCKARPMGCEDAPQGEVCGCDGVTYDSVCEAEQAGTTVASEGACAVVEVDECETVTCQNGGVCTDLPGDDTWECACAPGYTGTNCEIDIDECESSPCVNGDCQDLVNGWECLCAPGWSGLTCDTPVEVEVTCPCMELSADFAAIIADPMTTDEGGQCVINVGSNVGSIYGAGIYPPAPYAAFSQAVVSTYNDLPACWTQSDFVNGADITGTGSAFVLLTPEEAIACGEVIAAAGEAVGLTCLDECVSPNPCQNGGTCTDQPGEGTYTCECATGFSGTNCEIEEVYDPNACPCLDPALLDGQYAEIVQVLFSAAVACDTSVPGSASITGDFGGVTLDFYVSGGYCSNTYTDLFGYPQIPTTEIQAQDCIAQIEAAAAAASLTCDGGSVDECESSPCQNGGDCADGPDTNDYECACAPGYTGTNCEIDIDECESSPCVNGNCIDLVNAWECECQPGWEGLTCDTAVAQATCPCNTMPYWTNAVTQEEVTFCDDGVTLEAYYLADASSPYNMAALYITATTCGYEVFPHVGEGSMSITAEQAAACLSDLEAWRAASGITDCYDSPY